ncbi:MAG: hypothetical protein ACP5FH_05575, partial [Terracidiphilus sp.]
KCHGLPEPTREAHEIGKEFCGNGLCNPVYFTVGNLILYLRRLEAEGIERQRIVREYAFFTAGSNGPCRFGMYEAEFRAALREAGYDGFRVLLFQQDSGISADSGESGMRFSVDFGLDALHAFILGDLLNDLDHRLRPYEKRPGMVEEAMRQMTDDVAAELETAQRFELLDHAPGFLRPWLERRRESRLFKRCNTLGKVWTHLYGSGLTRVLARHGRQIAGVQLDWLRVRPVVKVIGEFWAQQTESDGNFQIFRFLEREGAEVAIEPLSNWVMYLLNQFRNRAAVRYTLVPGGVRWRHPLRAVAAWLGLVGRRALFTAGERIYVGHYRRLARALGMQARPLVPQTELARLANPFYSQNLRGGEGHLEVAKNLYYTRHRLCHLVLAMKPFGCMPSMQSDAVQAGLAARIREMAFLSVETAAEGEIQAYSRVQMALAEARARARLEFQQALRESGRTMQEIRAFVAVHPALRSPFYTVSRRPGISSTAANFLLDVDELMRERDERPARPWFAPQGAGERTVAGA